MPAFLASIHLNLSIVALICDLIKNVTDTKSFCLLVGACGLVYWFVRSTTDTDSPACTIKNTPEKRQQYREWMEQDEFVHIISQAMERAAEVVARENNLRALRAGGVHSPSLISSLRRHY